MLYQSFCCASMMLVKAFATVQTERGLMNLGHHNTPPMATFRARAACAMCFSKPLCLLLCQLDLEPDPTSKGVLAG